MKYISTFDLFEGYNKPRAGGKRRWSVKYKKKINCSNPKGFSQIQYCKRKRRGGHYKTESALFESLEDQIKSYLSQIFLELEDEGYDIEVTKINYHYVPIHLRDFKIKISGKYIEENVIPSIETSINYMSNEGFNRHWIMVENYGKLTMNELRSYFNLQKSLVNPPNRFLELNFQKD
jgi:hypothetical protein